MGQYWMTINLDKREYVNPHKLGCGLKLYEQLGSEYGTPQALFLLCVAMPKPRGGGDFGAPHPMLGRWAGDRLAVVGDYAEDGDLPSHASSIPASELYAYCHAETCDHGELFRDISAEVAELIERELGGKFHGDGWRRWVTDVGRKCSRPPK